MEEKKNEIAKCPWKKSHIIMFVILLAISGLFLNSFYWPEGEFLKRRSMISIATAICVMLVMFFSVKIKIFNNIESWINDKLEGGIQWIKSNYKKGILLSIGVLFAIGFSASIVFVFSRFILQNSFNWRLFYSLVACICVVLAVWLMWKVATNKPECVFVVFALIMGIYSIAITPTRVGVSWDDEIHYARTLEVSNFLNGIMYEADVKNIEEYATNIYSFNGYDAESNAAYDLELNMSYDQKDYRIHEFDNYGVWTISYIPAAIGIVFGRGLGLPYTCVFDMGRFFNLIMYILLFYLAIRKAKYGKVLLTAIGLIPTMIFMAANYSYDAWVVGFTVLGFSYFFAVLQEEKQLENKDIGIIIGTILLGCIPKAIYFPILFPLLFMPKHKFKNSKQRKVYYATIVGAGLLLVSSFLLPMLIGGAGTGDARGGDGVNGVNATEQIKFILNNPFAYAKILLEFELKYIGIANSGPMLQKLAYVGDGYFYTIVSFIILLLAFIDREQEEKNFLVIKGACLIGNIVAIVLSTTALYIDFTSVGLDTVSGMQARYLLPTVYPALNAIGFGKISHKINKNALVCVPVAIIAFTFIFNMMFYCALKYY